MARKNDLLDDILPMVISGILDPSFLTGEEKSEETRKEKKPGDPGERDRQKEK